MIGRSVGKTAVAKLAELRQRGAPVGKRTLVVGYGNVGEATAAALRREDQDVAIVDLDEGRRGKAQAGGLRVFATLEEALAAGHAEVVVGTTGEIAMSAAAMGRLPDGAVLINAASSATEFLPDAAALQGSLGAAQRQGDVLVTTFRGRPFVMGAAEGHQTLRRHDWVLHLGGKSVLLANQGAVINFDGSEDPIPPRYIQLTRGLLFLAAVQASELTGGERGLIALDARRQADWVDLVNADLARTGESLSAPRF
jgi:hypothetical protein